MDDVTRRTRLALERTWLAWFRTALGAAVAALGVGRLVPELLDSGRLPFGLLGIGYGILALALFAVGEQRRRSVVRALDDGGFAALGGRTAEALAAAGAGLALATVVLLLVEL